MFENNYRQPDRNNAINNRVYIMSNQIMNYKNSMKQTTDNRGFNLNTALIVGAIALGILLITWAWGEYRNETATIPDDTMGESAQLPSRSQDDRRQGGSQFDAPEMDVREFTVSTRSFAFNPAEIKVKKGDRVKITLTNTDGFHDWVVDEFNAKTGRINTGQTSSVEFVADKTGTFEYYCSVGNHRQMGMVGKLIVEE